MECRHFAVFPLIPSPLPALIKAHSTRGTTMALVDDIRNELAELVESAEETKGQAENYLRQPDEEDDVEEDRDLAAAVIQRMNELLATLKGIDLGEASVEEVSTLIDSAELALDQADEALDELGL
jgi:hypothetical protein